MEGGGTVFTALVVGLLTLALGVKGDADSCHGTSWSLEAEPCPEGYQEYYREVDGRGNIWKYCCPPTEKGEKNGRASATNCETTWCTAADDPCTTLNDRFDASGNKMEREEVLRDFCTDSHGSGLEALCCIKNTTQSLLVSTRGAEPHEFPHMAKLKIGNGQCGGTIYNKRFIITAGHCIWDTTAGQALDAEKVTIKVVLGSNDAGAYTDEFVYKVKRVIAHEGYDGLNTHKDRTNDIALLEVEKEIQFGKNVKALQIAPKGFRASKYAPLGVFVGWGLTPTLAVAVPLQKGNAILWSLEECFGEEGPWRGNGQGDTVMCVGGIVGGRRSPSTPSQGYSGGPIICRDGEGHPVHCGVVSYGADSEKCWEADDEKNCKPVGITQVAAYGDWLRSKAGEQDPETIYKPYLYGKEVEEEGEYPHQVHVTSLEGRACGGTLVAPDVVVTAAHCVVSTEGDQLKDLQVTTSVTDLTRDEGEVFGVTRVVSLPGFRKVPVKIEKLGSEDVMTDHFYKNDLAVIKLERSTDISPEKLPRIPEEGDSGYRRALELAFPKNATVGGGQMRGRNYKVLDPEDCQRRMSRLSSAGLNVKVDAGMLCGVEKYSGGSTCDRELGGGLICQKGGKEVLCGVQTFRLCTFSLPNGFVNLAEHKAWLEEAMQNLQTN